MKKKFLLVAFTLVLISCNVNPNKEGRLQKLETEITKVTDKIKEVENTLKVLKAENSQLKTRIDVLEAE